ncbi:beta strand repeat-containing protein [Fibrella aquatilis]|uniref:Curlin associated repeat-containing protein n=1 Tax=Fibrella aquatilis TaxID=2817059 RepID=A0A939G7Q3_9BACT|nr:hypothetical protein [Fibrella aquatilis]MBO0931581.1 hypothetical protein [Fibrella aquatilis]
MNTKHIIPLALGGLLGLGAFTTLQAQNTSTVNQSGKNQSTDVQQKGAGNNSVITQRTGTAGVMNEGNKAITFQQANSTSQTNQATINQLNGADFNQGTIRQTTGSGNTATIDQNGGNGFRSGGAQLYGGSPVGPGPANAGNEASITQTGSGNGDVNAGSVTSIRQNAGIAGASAANSATIQQIGSNNGSTVIDQNNLSIQNRATIRQGAVNGGVTNNGAVVLQTNNSQRNGATVGQEGSAKVAEVRQTDVSTDNRVNVKQTDVNGVALVYQTNNATYNEATVEQTGAGSGNGATVFQTDQSHYNQATIGQTGQNSAAFIDQSTQSANNKAAIEQGAGGSNNSAAIVQTYAYAGGSAGANTGLGTSNQASIVQNRTTTATTGNLAQVQQGFSGGISPVTGLNVISSGNQATINQENDMNATNLVQGGTANTATVAQKGNSTLRGLPTDPMITNPALQYGNNNGLTVTQTGTTTIANMANVNQIGNNNTGTITQTGSN